MAETSTLPIHLGLVLDGNRRWAREHGLFTYEGHRKGYDNLKDIAKAAFDRGVKYVSAFVFSTENWDRAKSEVNYLMGLTRRILTQDVIEFNEQNIKLVWFGNESRLSKKLIKLIRDAEELTKNNTKGTLCLCFNYGGHQEIADAFRKILESGKGSSVITPDLINKYLYQPDVPKVDLVVRTSGEQRLSGFMLWRIAYSELYFVNKHWPDFSEEDLDNALDFYAGRERRFGR